MRPRSSRRMPVKIGWPRPPAPMRAPSVAVPTLMTAALFTPAMIEGLASGSSIRHRRVPGGSPRASADSRNAPGIPVSPAWVLRTIGSRLYTNSAASAGTAPMPNSGIMNTRSASVGTVCTMPTAPSTPIPRRGRRAARTPSGIATRTAARSDTPTSRRCSPVRRKSARQRGGADTDGRGAPASPNVAWTKSAATVVSGTRSSLARAFRATIVRASIRPSRRRRASTAAAPARRVTSRRYRKTAS